jgi:aryl-alcohol dehydrogenase-like predicted oxidoreductase
MTMKYTFFGKTGLRVSQLCLGAMTFGEEWKGGGTSQEHAKQIFDAYVDHGGNFIDTANIYTGGTSETLVGKFVGDRRHEFVLATKYSITTNPKDANASGNHRKNMMRAVEESLRRLKTDYIDLYWVHLWDGVTPYDEVMRGLDDLVSSGKILYIGASDMPAWVVSQSNVLAELRGWTKFNGIQIEYNLAERTPEADLIPMAESHQLSVLDWSPLRMGVLTGKYLEAANHDTRYRLSQKGTFTDELQAIYQNEKGNEIAKVVVAIAQEINRTPAQVALNWILQKSPLHIPLIGARRKEHLLDNLGCLDFQLGDDDLKRLDEVSRVPLGFPHSFLSLQSTQEMLLIPDYKNALLRHDRGRNLVQ